MFYINYIKFQYYNIIVTIMMCNSETIFDIGMFLVKTSRKQLPTINKLMDKLNFINDQIQKY